MKAEQKSQAKLPDSGVIDRLRKAGSKRAGQRKMVYKDIDIVENYDTFMTLVSNETFPPKRIPRPHPETGAEAAYLHPKTEPEYLKMMSELKDDYSGLAMDEVWRDQKVVMVTTPLCKETMVAVKKNINYQETQITYEEKKEQLMHYGVTTKNNKTGAVLEFIMDKVEIEMIKTIKTDERNPSFFRRSKMIACLFTFPLFSKTSRIVKQLPSMNGMFFT